MPKSKAWKITSVRLTDEHWQSIVEEREKTGKSTSRVIKDALDFYLYTGNKRVPDRLEIKKLVDSEVKAALEELMGRPAAVTKPIASKSPRVKKPKAEKDLPIEWIGDAPESVEPEPEADKDMKPIEWIKD